MRYLLLFLMLLFTAEVFAQTGVQKDEGFVEARSLDKAALSKLKKDRDFQYDRSALPVENLWDKFWRWFWWKVSQILATKEGRTTLWTLFIVFGIAMIAFFVMKVTGMSKAGLFGRSSNAGLNYTTTSEDIHGIAFDAAIDQAIADGNYRLAIRLMYLQALKSLSDKGYIQWQINKTNTDYLFEVSAKPWYPVFRILTYSFEYTWYGETPVSRDRFQDLRNQFQQFNNQLQ